MRPSIDVHSHVVPATFTSDRDGSPWRPLLDAGTERGEVYVHGRHFRSVTRSCWDLARRREEIAGRGISRQVLSPMPELFSYAAPVDACTELCAEVNDWIAAAVADGEGAFDGFGMVPLQAPDVAASSLQRLQSAGLRGVEVGSHVEGMPLHDPRFAEFYAEAARLGLVVFVHSFHPPGAECFGHPAAANAVLFPVEIGRALAGLVTEGVLLREPALRVLGSHGGGALAQLLPRLDMMWRVSEGFDGSLDTAPSELACRLHVDSLVYDHDLLTLVAKSLGDGSLTHGTDFPFLPDPSPPPTASLAARMDTNATRLLRDDHAPAGPTG